MIAVNLTRHFQVTGCDRAELDRHADAVFEELLKLEGPQVTDADMSIDLWLMQVSISVVAVGENESAAAIRADATIRTAIHAAHGSTPGWAYPVWQESDQIERELVEV